jgi:hypothetical protein
MAVLQHFDEGDEEVGHPLPQLLYIGMLISGPLVTVNRNALVDDVAIQVFFFTEGFHHQLLQIAGKQQQTVFVGQHYHVFFPLAVARVVPGTGPAGRRGFASGQATRVAASISLAPASKARISMPS